MVKNRHSRNRRDKKTVSKTTEEKTMTATGRKEKTENLLKEWNIPVYDNIPTLEEEESVKLKTDQEVAKRIIILAYLNCAAQIEVKQEILAFLKAEALWESVTEEEKELFEKPAFTEDEITTILWRSESILLLLWALRKVQTLDVPIEEVDMNDIIRLLPPFLSSTADFVHSATLRSVSEILDQADLIFRLHWVLRQAHVDGSAPLALHPGIVYERNYAIDWVTCVRDQWNELA